jgi:hypothetical protein
MRTLRLWLAGTLTVMLLGGLGGAVVAQMDADADAVYVTRVSMEPVSADASTVAETETLRSARGGVTVQMEEWSDPRGSGMVTIPWNTDVDPKTGQGIMWGTNLFENDGGTWEGPCSGIVYRPPDQTAGTSVGVLGGPGAFLDVTCWLTGTGDYAGYTFFIQEDGFQNSGPTRVIHGVIYKGQPPVSELPAE